MISYEGAYGSAPTEPLGTTRNLNISQPLKHFQILLEPLRAAQSPGNLSEPPRTYQSLSEPLRASQSLSKLARELRVQEAGAEKG